MIVYTNIRRVAGPYGGAYNFMSALFDCLTRKGYEFHGDISRRSDAALLNALSDGATWRTAEQLANRGIPVIHRKVGYVVSGSPEMRAVSNGKVRGDELQMDFDPYVRTTIFQSDYSAAAFRAQGYKGNAVVIRNGTNETLFNLQMRSFFGLRHKTRKPWRGGRIRIAISTWSTDPNKGFAEYHKIDGELKGRSDVEIRLAGRIPKGLRFEKIAHVGALRATRLAEFLKNQHVILNLSRLETCSNSLIEALNCGLPAVYLDSGSNGEIAGKYGVAWTGDLSGSLNRLFEDYESYYMALPSNPFRLSLVAPEYERVLQSVVAN